MKSAIELELEAHLKETHRIMRELDITGFRKMMSSTESWLGHYEDEVAFAAIHKARYESCEIERELRLQSEQWLRERGYHRIGGGDLLPPGELPSMQ